MNTSSCARPHPHLHAPTAKPESSPSKGPSLEKIALIVLGAVVLFLLTFLSGYELARSNDLAAEPADANSCAAASNATATAAFRMAQQDTWASIQSLSGTASVEEFLQCHGVSTAAGIRCSPSNPLLTPQNTIQLAFYQQGSTVSAIITATAPRYGGTVDTSDVEAFNVTIGIRGLDATGIDLNGPGSQMFPRFVITAQQHFEATMLADDLRVGAIVLSWPVSTNLVGVELYVASTLPVAMDFEVLGNTFTPVETGIPTSEHPLVIDSGMPMPDVNVATISMPAARRAAVDWAPRATNLTSSGSIEAKIGTTLGQEHENALQTFSQQTGTHFEVLSDPRSGGDGNGAFINLTNSVTGRYAYLSFTHSQQLGDNITGTLNGSATMGVFTFDPSTGATTSSTTLLSDVGGASAGQRFGDPVPSWVTELMVQQQAEMSTELDLPPLNSTRGRRDPLTRIILGQINSRIPCHEFSTTSRRACCACGQACLGAALSCGGCALAIYSGNVLGAIYACDGCVTEIYHIGSTAQNCRVCIR